MASIPDKEESTQLWEDLATDDRRTVMRAVGRGEPLRNRGLARAAIGRARQQQTYWKWTWLVAPAVALLSLRQGVVPFLVQLVLLTGLMGGFARYKYVRARTAEEANIGRITGKVKAPPPEESSGIGLMDRLHNTFRARDLD